MANVSPIGFSVERNVASASVTLSSPVIGATIRYTTDGSEPTAENGTTYTGSFELVGTKTVKAVVIKEGLINSVIAKLEINVVIPDIVLEREDGTAIDNCKVIIVNMDAYETFTGLVFRYTLDGSEPTEDSPIMTGELDITVNCTVKVKGFSEDFGNVDTASIIVDDLMVQTPIVDYTIEGTSGTVTITCANSDAEIRYTIDGSEPTENSTLYTASFTVELETTVKAKAFKDGLLDSEIAEELIIDPMQIWTAIEDTKIVTSSGKGINSICYAIGKFVAVADEGKASYSEDGINWVAIEDIKINGNINSITYGNGKFVAVADEGKASYSEDGINWVAIEDTKFIRNINSICYGNGKFVAVGDGGKASYSIDGINWTAIDGINGHRYSICYANGKFVAVGYSNNASYSEDGINWTAIEDMKFTRNIYGITYGNGKFVAVGGDREASYSEDGINWTAIEDIKTSIEIGTLYSICYGNGKFVTPIRNNKASYSEDGINWTTIEDTKINGNGLSIVYGNGKFIIGSNVGIASYCISEETKVQTPIIRVVE